MNRGAVNSLVTFAAIIHLICALSNECVAQPKGKRASGTPQVILEEEPQWRDPHTPNGINQFSDSLRLTLHFDRVINGKIETSIAKNVETVCRYETDYIGITDSVYVKIFFARTEEYGKKMYMWRWDYFKKRGASFQIFGGSYYRPLEFDEQQYLHVRNYGQGIGVVGEKHYFMVYYRFYVR